MNDAALTMLVREKAAPKFKGRQTLRSAVKPRYPVAVEREFVRAANKYIGNLNIVLGKYLPVIQKAITAESQVQRGDSGEDIQSLITRIFEEAGAELQKKNYDHALIEKISQIAVLGRYASVKEWQRIIKQTLDIDIEEEYYIGEFYRHAMDVWVARNVLLFEQTMQAGFNDIHTAVRDGYAAGSSNAQIWLAILIAYENARARAQFIARDQLAKLYAEMSREQQRDAGIEGYVWVTTGDEFVRADHNWLDGRTFKWAEPPVISTRYGRVGHPGDDYNCRCLAMPIFDLSTLTLPWRRGA